MPGRRNLPKRRVHRNNDHFDNLDVEFNHDKAADDNDDNLEHHNVGYGDDEVYDLVDVNDDAEDTSRGDGTRSSE